MVYIINFRLCNYYYVGQTKKIKRRMRDHLNTCFFNNTFGGNCHGVSEHFNKPGHKLEKDFNFTIKFRFISSLHVQNYLSQIFLHYKIIIYKGLVNSSLKYYFPC